LLDDTYREAEEVVAEGRRKAEAPLTSKQAAAATAGIEGAIFDDCVCVLKEGEEEADERMVLV